jgi:hypothetical protein
VHGPAGASPAVLSSPRARPPAGETVAGAAVWAAPPPRGRDAVGRGPDSRARSEALGAGAGDPVGGLAVDAAVLGGAHDPLHHLPPPRGEGGGTRRRTRGPGGLGPFAPRAPAEAAGATVCAGMGPRGR